MTTLQSKRDVRAAVRGFADAFATDSTYALAAFDFGIVAAISDRWDDAIEGFSEAVRLDAGLGPQATPQIERLRLIAKLEATPDGKRRRVYDEALLPLLAKLPKMLLSESVAALTEIGRIDATRWESPALLATLLGNSGNYDSVAQYLKTAVINAAEPKVKASLQNALNAAERENRYAAARAAAEAASDAGDHEKAAKMFETAWLAVPARSGNGLSAASEVLLGDDTARATVLLERLKVCGDSALQQTAAAMLKELEPIEPAASAAAVGDVSFFKDPGSYEPVRISTLLPPIDRAEMELLTRPLPKLVGDSEPVVLLSSLSAVNLSGETASLPALPDPSITFDNAWHDSLKQGRKSSNAFSSIFSAPEETTVDLSKHTKMARYFKVATEPAGATIFLDNQADAACQSPCKIRLDPGSYAVRFSYLGYGDEQRTVDIKGKDAELLVPLSLTRGFVLVEATSGASFTVDGTPIGAKAPAELALIPGLHRISANFGPGTTIVRTLNVVPGAHLRFVFKQ